TNIKSNNGINSSGGELEANVSARGELGARNIHQATLYYYNLDETPINIAMRDILILCKKEGIDVFSMYDVMENKVLVGLPELHFQKTNQRIYYYLYNWKCPPMYEQKVGTNQHSSQIGYVPLV